MTAFVGFCKSDGAFLAADGRRTQFASDNKTVTGYSKCEKIEELSPQIVIASGGLGTVGEEARNEVIQKIESDALEDDLDGIEKVTKETFEERYEESLIKNPGHQIPLYAILAGRKPSTGGGFISVIKSNRDFKKSDITPGSPFMTGSDTALVGDCASKVYHAMKDMYPVAPLDLWAAKSIEHANRHNKQIGFPVQFALAEDTVTMEYSVTDPPRSPDTKYQVEWDDWD